MLPVSCHCGEADVIEQEAASAGKMTFGRAFSLGFELCREVTQQVTANCAAKESRRSLLLTLISCGGRGGDLTETS